MFKLLWATCLVVVFSSFAATHYAIQFRMLEPTAWYTNLGKGKPGDVRAFTIQNSKLNLFLRSPAREQQMYMLYKYNPDKVSGAMPTIQAFMVKTQFKTKTEALQYTSEYIKNLKAIATDFKLVENPHYIAIGKKKAICSLMEYQARVSNVGTISIRTKTLEIQLGKLTLFLTFMDDHKNDCSLIYNKMIYSIDLDGDYFAGNK